jgi:dGTPase
MDWEEKTLAAYAVKNRLSRGREHVEPEDPTRTPFQKDRDRVLHCRAFRRLKMKTQVFVADYGDHYRTRLMHSLEVSQVSRDVARALGLNEDLCETVALAHDLGHTPFGHAGEHALDEVVRPYGLHFEHNEQSKRIVEKLERVYPGFPGLNLTFEVRQGLMKHQSPWDQSEKVFKGASLEAQIVNLADEIAYNNHDVDDGLRSGLITEEQLMEVRLWTEASQRVTERYGVLTDARVRVARTISMMIGMMIQDLIEHSTRRIEASGVATLEDVYRHEENLILFSPEQYTLNHELKDFLTHSIYFHPRVLSFSNRGQEIIRQLFEAYHAHPEWLPQEEQDWIAGGQAGLPDRQSREEVIKDYIAGMTDDFAESELERVGGLA